MSGARHTIRFGRSPVPDCSVCGWSRMGYWGVEWAPGKIVRMCGPCKRQHESLLAKARA